MPSRVFVNDDSAPVRKNIPDALTVAGSEVIGAATDPLIAMTRMNGNVPDAVVLDIEMPHKERIICCLEQTPNA